MGVPNPGSYKEILNSDDKKYGGSGVTNGTVKDEEGPDARLRPAYFD